MKRDCLRKNLMQEVGDGAEMWRGRRVKDEERGGDAKGKIGGRENEGSKGERKRKMHGKERR